MAARTISEFKAQLLGGGARPNQFEVELTFPGFVSLGSLAGQKAQFMVMAASLPASRIDVAPAPFRGRFVFTAGERTFDPWTITVLNDTDFLIRNSMEQWQQAINNNITNVGLTNPSDYQSRALVHQLSRSGDRIKSYTFEGMFPVEVAPIDLAYDANNVIEQFGVTFNYQFWTSNTTG
jgi:hypothetical protein